MLAANYRYQQYCFIARFSSPGPPFVGKSETDLQFASYLNLRSYIQNVSKMNLFTIVVFAAVILILLHCNSKRKSKTVNSDKWVTVINDIEPIAPGFD